jgi:hypothetical protein
MLRKVIGIVLVSGFVALPALAECPKDKDGKEVCPKQPSLVERAQNLGPVRTVRNVIDGSKQRGIEPGVVINPFSGKYGGRLRLRAHDNGNRDNSNFAGFGYFTDRGLTTEVGRHWGGRNQYDLNLNGNSRAKSPDPDSDARLMRAVVDAQAKLLNPSGNSGAILKLTAGGYVGQNNGPGDDQTEIGAVRASAYVCHAIGGPILGRKVAPCLGPVYDGNAGDFHKNKLGLGATVLLLKQPANAKSGQ